MKSDKTQDSRSVRKTKNAIQEAFLKLLEKKPYQRITVTELVDLADVSRATFYLHYIDIYDLVEKLEDQIIEMRESEVMKLDVQGMEYIEVSRRVLGGLYAYDGPLKYALQLLVGPNGDIAFLSRIKAMLIDTSMELRRRAYKDDGMDEDLNRMCSLIVVGSCMDVFVDSWKNGSVFDKEKMSLILGEMSLKGEDIYQKYRE